MSRDTARRPDLNGGGRPIPNPKLDPVCGHPKLDQSADQQGGGFARKSTPRIGLETAAKMKVQRKARAPKFNVLLMDPNDEIDFPSAPERGGPVEGFCEE